MKLQDWQSKISNIHELIQDLVFELKDNEINISDKVVLIRHRIGHTKLIGDHPINTIEESSTLLTIGHALYNCAKLNNFRYTNNVDIKVMSINLARTHAEINLLFEKTIVLLRDLMLTWPYLSIRKSCLYPYTMNELYVLCNNYMKEESKVHACICNSCC